MPQASKEVVDNFKGNQKDAFDVLDLNFRESRGYFYPKVEGYEPTDKETWALRYLVEEWDYGYCKTKPSFEDENDPENILDEDDDDDDDYAAADDEFSL